TSMARGRLVPGEGAVAMNGKPLDDSCARDGATEQALLPFSVTNTARRFNAMIKVTGGGVTGQIGAIAHGISRALLQVDREHLQALRRAGLLTRDPRAKERKKPGLKRARKAPQFTKRQPWDMPRAHTTAVSPGTNYNYQVALNEGLQYLKQGRLRQAEQSFKYLVDKFPGAEGGYRGLAKVHFEQEDRASALRVLRDGAAALTKSGERPQAIGLLREAITLEPRDLATHRRL